MKEPMVETKIATPYFQETGLATKPTAAPLDVVEVALEEMEDTEEAATAPLETKAELVLKAEEVTEEAATAPLETKAELVWVAAKVELVDIVNFELCVCVLLCDW